jgi:hypothetical protein
LNALGVIAAVVWYHPYRIIKEIKERLRHYRRVNRLHASVGFWQMAHDDVLNLGSLKAYICEGPHWHAIASGYLENIITYADRKIGGYKKVRYLDSETEVRKVGYYLSTHACREATKSTVRYYGKISYSKLSKGEPQEKIEDCLCELCGKHLQEHHCLDTGEVTGLAKEKVTRKVITFKYWKRGTKPKVTRQAGLTERAMQIWGPAGPPGQVPI